MPQIEPEEPAMPKTEVGSHHLSLRSGMADAALACADYGDRKTPSRTANGQVIARRRTLGGSASSGVRISEKKRLHILRFVTDPTYHVDMVGRMYVTHKAMKLTVTFGRPACDVARKVTNGA